MTAACSKALRASLGPVQGWITAGRRTRDFWAGSFLLSRLAGEAMHAVVTAGGDISIPVVGSPSNIIEPTLRAIAVAEYQDPCAGPLVGTLVNHFRAIVPDHFDPAVIETAVRVRFQAIAKEVFDAFIGPVLDQKELLASAKVEELKERWAFQCSGAFFETLWVTEDIALDNWQAENLWLARRKTWRDHPPLMEVGAGLPGTGDRCPVHPELCELGGFSGMSTTEKESQTIFWSALQHQVSRYVYGEKTSLDKVTLEIRGNEHLSALALVKRLFPLLKPDALTRAIGWVPDHAFDPVTNTGSLYLAEAQKALRNWPSTAFISAIPWIVRVGETNAEASEVFAQNQLEVLDQRAQAERPQYSRIQGIDNILLDVPMFSALDGTLHFSERLDKRQYSEASARLVPILRENISEFHKDLGQEKGRTPTAFYAMLDMDGDHMGHVFSSSLNNARIGSTALLEFAAAVPGIIREHDGVTIYAGADDVNAMLPIDNAIACASAIRKKWQEVFDNLSFNPKLKNPPTLSGSIVFADYQNALDEVRRVAHTRLDQVAKDGCGRNALALAVMKSGGITAEWASQWEADGSSKTDQIMDLAQVFCSGDVAKKFPYKIRSRFTEILEAKVEQDHLFSVAQIGQILLKEFADSGLGDDPEKYKSWTTLMGSVIGPAAGGGSAKRHVGGILIARFLAQNVDWAYLELRWPASSPGPLKTAPQAAPT